LFPDEAGLPEDLPSPVRTLDIRGRIVKQREEKEAAKAAKEQRAQLKKAKNAAAKKVRDEAREQQLQKAEPAPFLEPVEEEFEEKPKEKAVWKTKIQLLNNLGIKLSQYKSNAEIKKAVNDVMKQAYEREVDHKLQFGNAEITEEEKEKRMADEQSIRQILEAAPEPELEELDWANIGPEIEAEESDVEEEIESPKVESPKVESPAALPIDKPARSPSQGRFGGNGLDFKHIKLGNLSDQFNQYNNHFLHKIHNLEEFAHLVITHPKLFDKRLLKKCEFYINVLAHYKSRK
jgi:hypothetical protein